MSQVNLLPPEIRQRQQTRQLALTVLAGGAIVLLLIIFAYLLQARSLASVNNDIDAQRRINAGLNGQIADLRPFQDLQNEAQAKRQLLAAVFSNEVSFSEGLLDVSRVMPADAYLTSLTVTINPPAQGTTTGTPTGIIGSIAFSGEGLSADTVATLLTRLERVRGWANPYVTSVIRPGSTDVVQFTGTVDLTTDALTKRGAGAGATG
ncbi:MAG: hypothetical protein HY240_08575 [Actinobacteria bacterium]|nr:hypothetical protein [Actinomycetota bacterium]